MKWITGKPKNVDEVIMRRISNPLFIITEIYEYDSEVLDTGKETIRWDDVEWLDESTPSNLWQEIDASVLPEKESSNFSKVVPVFIGNNILCEAFYDYSTGKWWNNDRQGEQLSGVKSYLIPYNPTNG